jgi:hypothetical protein
MLLALYSVFAGGFLSLAVLGHVLLIEALVETRGIAPEQSAATTALLLHRFTATS